MNIIRREDFNQICRFCLSITTLNNIFQDKTLLTIIREVSLVQVSSDDGLPKSLCENCINQVTQFCIFKKRTLESETKLKQILSDTNSIKTENSIEEIKFEDHDNITNTVDIPDIDESKKNFVTVDGESDNQSETSTSETDEEYFDVTSDSEVETLRKTYNFPKKMEIIFKDIQTFQSRQCENFLEIQAHESKIINCICGLNFTDESEYAKHRKHPKHTRWRPAFCDVCGKSYRNKSSLKIHMRTHTNEKPYECELCLMKFSQRINYLRHLKVHLRALPYNCEICGLSFRDSSTLDTHSKTHSTDKPYTCQFCRVDLTSKQNLNSHLKKNHLLIYLKYNNKDHLCSFCGKICKNLQSFKDHSIRFHSNEKPFECSVCSKKFKTKLELHQHTKTHNAIKKYVCQICSKKFAQTAHLNRHLKTHTGEKKLQCKFCDKRFALKYNLTTHERIHTGEKPYVCDICSKEFNASYRLKKHKMIHEKNSQR